MAASRAEVGTRVKRTVVSLAITGAILVASIYAIGPGAYDWIKSLHVIAVISWMAGMLYLPRLFVYHCGVAPGSEASETFKVMERKLLRYIINPAMVVSWVAGLWIAIVVFGFHGGWLHAKLALVLGLSAAHGYFAKAVADFARDEGNRNHRHWRFMNEVPTLIMIAVVILVIVKPF
ncbi:protoporphyrinogen oxidase HemJ [Pinisolibacter aquiterrae]|uniref:protoporphyrinogen oxidase HemJ n=1 Tax=Pinisolibacter aquiterrae TaxID=2815579 RepID=UPI001C3CF6B3|nr:protoporphyrinogen oxidase HemJ [Pinisolibacter aquiterrae]MBV5266163.1 protoporphyrinogen oxidase HemJ [Pinisolibacter aquiterrae]MCC8236251.1 protoporphyrinogen oxidase HemJ [Pinisolibacter aquiterrae]